MWLRIIGTISTIFFSPKLRVSVKWWRALYTFPQLPASIIALLDSIVASDPLPLSYLIAMNTTKSSLSLISLPHLLISILFIFPLTNLTTGSI
jgi:hypothetical protein